MLLKINNEENVNKDCSRVAVSLTNKHEGQTRITISSDNYG